MDKTKHTPQYVNLLLQCFNNNGGMGNGATGRAAYRRARHIPGRMVDNPPDPHYFGCSFFGVTHRWCWH
eukprot:scaffold129547_cov17-Tisochrysis_lutea.AAC.1